MANIVQIIVGSESDLEAVKKSGMIRTMEQGGLDCRLAVASAHRNPAELEQLCQEVLNQAVVFICVAGMATALPGAVAANTKQYVPVIAVPLDEHGIDSCLYMPPGVPVALAGVGSAGLKNAALLALQIWDGGELDQGGFWRYMDKLRSAKPAKPDLYRTGLGYKLNEGKTKVIWGDPEGHEVTIESKDDITAGDGAKRDEIEGKAALATTTTVNCFRTLQAAGIPTAFVRDHDQRHFKARRVEMIPLELVARRLATGSYLKRNHAAVEGEVFDPLVFELFYKDDAQNDPIVIPVGVEPVDGLKLYLHSAKLPVHQETLIEVMDSPWSMEQLERLEELTRMVFEVLEEQWANQGITLVDLKIECGFDAETGQILVADVIDNDSWRLWPGGDKSQMLDKQVYRDLQDVEDPAAKAKELGKIKANYAEVARMTGNFHFG